MARVNINILGISELKWTEMGKFNSDDHYIYYSGQESLRRNGVAIIVNKTVRNAVLACNLKNDRVIAVRFQGNRSVSSLCPNHWCRSWSWMVLWRPITSSRINTKKKMSFSSYNQFSSVAQSYLTLCDPMNHSRPSLPVHHQLPEFTQTHVHRVSDAIQPSHPLSSPFPPAPYPSQHQRLFQWVSSSHEVAKVLEFQLQH